MNYPRFSRITRLIGDQSFNNLQGAKVCIVGLGAVGSSALEALARSGITTFTLVDFDKIGITNINRQIIALESTLGQYKVDVATQRVLDINSECKVTPLKLFAHSDTFDQIFFQHYDVVIDAIDSLTPKLSLLEYAYKNNLYTISSMGAALKQDPTSIRVADLMDTHTCALARQVRSKLRRRGVSRGITAVFSEELVEFDYKEPEEEQHVELNEQILQRGRQRKVLGSLPTITGIFGLTIAHHAIQHVIGEK
jgi:tRNA A37 threonylcarbamoyladenosine dehydratase